jgi:cellulose synthase/poly-beta-1,6-N-acetylglucosamine synthase-like glycosyltransferase
MIVLSLLLGGVALTLLLPTLSDVLSIVLQRSARAPVSPSGERLLVLVPAHNEASVLADCLSALKRAANDAGAVDVVVVADNCTDQTAEIATGLGVRCLERRDIAAPGKPPALAWALEQLAGLDYDALAVVDADTLVDPGFCTALLAAGSWRGRAGQGRQRVRTLTRTWLTGLSELLFEVRYGLALPLKARAALNSPLTGTGMVFGRDVISPDVWRSFGPTEDIELYGRLTAAGTPIAYVGDAVVTVLNEAKLKASVTQRRRWSAGRWLASQRYLSAVIRSPRVSVRQKLDATAELLVPGPVEHLLIAVAALAVAGLGVVAAGPLLIVLFITGLVRPALYTVLALCRHPQPLRALGTLTMLPVYAAWRLAVTLSAPAVFVSRKWEKTKRVTLASNASD